MRQCYLCGAVNPEADHQAHMAWHRGGPMPRPKPAAGGWVVSILIIAAAVVTVIDVLTR